MCGRTDTGMCDLCTQKHTRTHWQHAIAHTQVPRVGVEMGPGSDKIPAQPPKHVWQISARQRPANTYPHYPHHQTRRVHARMHHNTHPRDTHTHIRIMWAHVCWPGQHRVSLLLVAVVVPHRRRRVARAYNVIQSKYNVAVRFATMQIASDTLLTSAHEHTRDTSVIYIKGCIRARG